MSHSSSACVASCDMNVMRGLPVFVASLRIHIFVGSYERSMSSRWRSSASPIRMPELLSIKNSARPFSPACCRIFLSSEGFGTLSFETALLPFMRLMRRFQNLRDGSIPLSNSNDFMQWRAAFTVFGGRSSFFIVMKNCLRSAS